MQIKAPKPLEPGHWTCTHKNCTATATVDLTEYDFVLNHSIRFQRMRALCEKHYQSALEDDYPIDKN